MTVKHLPQLTYNWISGIGAVLASVAFLTSVVFLILGFVFTGMSSPYIGILTYLVGPALTLFGLVLIPFGMWLKSRSLKQGKAEEHPHWPRIDFNEARTRRGAALLAVGMAIYVVASTVGSFEAYRYTDSVPFCGKLCHTVMEPQYVTHALSPHAVVSCTSCHVGPGVGWYARSKIRGLSRVYAVATSSYPRPIPIPLSDLRPEELQCHQCHWPENFFGGRHKVFHNYLYDTANTPWPVEMIIHTGGGDPNLSQAGGIHWYMYIGYTVEYIARDKQRQDIPWVRATNKKTGEVTVYQDQDNPLSEEEIAVAAPRTIDCIDCHDSCAHILNTPDEAIDTAMLLGQIDSGLPGVKKAAVAAMAASYPNHDTAMKGIASSIDQFFQEQPDGVYAQWKAEIGTAVLATQQRYSQNVFPYMKAGWNAYPNNLNHLYYKACFRCHLGRHRSKSGKTIVHDCTTCHRIISQGSGQRSEAETGVAGLTFTHPVDIAGLWKTMACSKCHTGAGVGGEASAGPAPAKPPAEVPQRPALSPQEKAKVKQVYDRLCVKCHAEDGKGNSILLVAMPQLPDFTNSKWQASHSDAEMAKVILDGKDTMPPSKGELGEVSAKQMVAYVRLLAQGAEAAQTKPKPKPSGKRE